MTRFVLLVCATSAAIAQEPSALKREFLAEFDHAVKQTVALAEAIPAEKYTWRPAEGVRSVSQVLMHIAAGNHLLLGVVGVKPPAELYPSGNADVKTSRELEAKIAGKDRVVAALKASFAAARNAIDAAADVHRAVKFFGSDATVRRVHLRIVVHANEHMGQLIAYARAMGVAPPWAR